MRWRDIAKYVFVGITFVSAFHYSVFVTYGNAGPPGAAPSPGALHRAYDAVVRVGRALGMSTSWRMYTPSPSKVRVARAYALRGDGTWVEVPLANLSPEHREARSVWDAWLFDFKRAIVLRNYIIRGRDERATRAFLRHVVRRVRRRADFQPHQIKIVVRSEPIPPPAEKEDWHPLEAELDTISRVFTYP